LSDTHRIPENSASSRNVLSDLYLAPGLCLGVEYLRLCRYTHGR